MRLDYELTNFTAEIITKINKDNFDFQERVKPIFKDLVLKQHKLMEKRMLKVILDIPEVDISSQYNPESYGVIRFDVKS